MLFVEFIIFFIILSIIFFFLALLTETFGGAGLTVYLLSFVTFVSCMITFMVSMMTPWKTIETVVPVHTISGIQLIVYKDIENKPQILNVTKHFEQSVSDNSKVKVKLRSPGPYSMLYYHTYPTYELINP